MPCQNDQQAGSQEEHEMADPNRPEKRNVEGVDLKRRGKERSWRLIVSTFELHAAKLELSLTNHGRNSSVMKSITVLIRNNAGSKFIFHLKNKTKLQCDINSTTFIQFFHNKIIQLGLSIKSKIISSNITVPGCHHLIPFTLVKNFPLSQPSHHPRFPNCLHPYPQNHQTWITFPHPS